MTLRIWTTSITLLAFAAAACAPTQPAPPKGEPVQPVAAQTTPGEAYKVGLSAAITGPVASSYGPSYEGLKAYIDYLNQRGGINGRRIEFIALDDRGEPPRATANAKRLVEDEKVLLLLSNSASAVYAPMIAASRNNNTPLLFLGTSVCPQEVFPPNPDPLLFCASFNMLFTDAEAIIKALRDLQGGQQVKLGLVAMDIPISRQGVDLIEKKAKDVGIDVVAKVATPPDTADYTPFATRFIESRATFIAHWGPFEIGIGMFGALTKLGWSGIYIATASPLAEQETVRFRQPHFYVIPSYAFTVDGLPVFKEIEQASKQAGIASAVDTLTLGWVGGLALEESLKQCGWPCDRAKLRDAMEKVKVDTKGLFGGPIDWSPTNHVRSAAFYKLYRWDEARQQIVQVKDWFQVDVK